LPGVKGERARRAALAHSAEERHCTLAGSFSHNTSKSPRFEASLVLDHPGGVKHARTLVEEAHALDPTDPQVRLRTLLAYRDTGSEAALALLQGQEDVESRNLHAAILLEMGHAAECFAVLDFATTPLALPSQGLTPSAETFRVRALAHLVTKHVAQASLDIQKALALEPHWDAYAMLPQSYSTAGL